KPVAWVGVLNARDDGNTSWREKVLEALESLWKLMKDIEASCRRLQNMGPYSKAHFGGGNTNHGLKIDVPKPSPFLEKREAKAVDDFLWEMEQYLEGVNMVDDASKIKTSM
nr:putative retrotransposon Gag domain, aspartic peptidase domain protein [Tanacetum cinerariifolium]